MEIGSDSIRFYIDQPAYWRAMTPCLIIRGWGFGKNGKPLCGIRLLVARCAFHGVTGQPRPDVKSAIPEAPDDFTGFEIRAPLPAGNHELSLSAMLPDGDWHTFLVQSVNVSRTWWPRWLGGGRLSELIAFQMPAHHVHTPRPLQAEKFPQRHPRPAIRLSVITPSFQQATYLEQTMISVLDQIGGPATDYVVQDGGSVDGSVAVIRRFATGGERRKEMGERKTQNGRQRTVTGSKENPAPCSPLPAPRLVSWTSEPDGGQADAIAKGFAKTSGGPDDIMAWINSDDFYLPGALGYVADYFSRHPDVDAIYGHRIVVNEESQEIARWFLPKHDAEVLRLNDFVPQETLFWRRRIWDKVSGLDTSFKFAMDWDLLLRFQAAGAKIVRVPYFLACFRIHAAQKTSAAMHTIGQKEIDLLRTRTHGREISPSELESDPRLIRYLRRSAFIEFLWKLGLRAP